MIAIVNQRFEPPIGFQTSGGPGWKTQIVSLTSGAEARNALWAGPLRKWQISGVPVNETASRQLIQFFNARSGTAQGFLFRDPFGYSTAEPGNSISSLDEAIGEGDGATREFQLSLDDGGAQRRVITRPVPGSLRVAINGVETNAFSLNDKTGILTFDTAPPAAGIITAGFEFDVPVRFEADRLELSQPANGAFQLVRLSLIEVREAA